jgi:hypothetical protein
MQKDIKRSGCFRLSQVGGVGLLVHWSLPPAECSLPPLYTQTQINGPEHAVRWFATSGDMRP